jgi:hypothetical protein
MTGPTPPRNKSGSRAQRPARRLSSLEVMPLLMVLIHTGCDFPIPSSKYEVGWGGTKGAEASAGSVALFEEPASPEVFRIVSAFAGGDTSCGQSFVEECAEVLNACANAPRCVEFSECVRGRALPTAETTCADELGASTEETWAFERTRHCWATRYAQCEIGKDFSCAYAYNAPGSKSSSITISQQLLLLNEEQAESDFTVTFCDALSDCSPPLDAVIPNRLTGIYDLTLDMPPKNSGVGNGWIGHRRIEGPRIYPSLVEANLPFWSHRTEITRIFSTESIDYLSSAYGGDARNAVFVQVVDCQSDPAPGITVELPDSPSAIVRSVTETSIPLPGPTFSTGAVGIFGHDGDKLHAIVALRGGVRVAEWSGLLRKGMPVYLRLYPSMAQ